MTNTNTSEATRMFERDFSEAQAYVKRYRRLQLQQAARECEHGHLGCAAWERGPCIDELLHLLEERT